MARSAPRRLSRSLAKARLTNSMALGEVLALSQVPVACALQHQPNSRNRSCAICRATMTRRRMAWLESPEGAFPGLIRSTGGTSIWMSIRSRIGPESRLKYLTRSFSLHVQRSPLPYA